MTKKIFKHNTFKVLLGGILASSSLFGASSVYKNSVQSGSYVPAPQVVMESDETSLSDSVYLQLGLGGASFSVEETYYGESYYGRPIASIALEQSAWLGDVTLGYQFVNGFYVSGSLQYSHLEAADLMNYYATLGYKMDFRGVNPFFGVNIGSGTLSWDDEYSIFGDNERVSVSTEMYFGLEFGLEFVISNELSITGKYQYFMNNQTTNFYAGDITHESQSNLIVGLQVSF